MLKNTMNKIQIKMIVKGGSMSLGPPLSKNEGIVMIPTEVEKNDPKLDAFHELVLSKIWLKHKDSFVNINQGFY